MEPVVLGAREVQLPVAWRTKDVDAQPHGEGGERTAVGVGFVGEALIGVLLAVLSHDVMALQPE
jgi:hypothetical protein